MEFVFLGAIPENVKGPILFKSRALCNICVLTLYSGYIK